MTEYIKVEDIISKNVDSYSKIVAEVGNKEIGDTAESTDATKMKVQCCRCRPDWFVVDGLGITCSGLTYILILFGEFVVIGVILLPFFPGSPWSYIHAVLFSCCAILAGCSHLRAMTTNPGTIPKGNFTDENVKHLGLKSGDVVIRCTRCECIKTERAHHCSTCQRCIRKMDHHCPWINNCVGEFNQKYFVLFTFYIMTLSAYAMALAIHYVFKCSDNDWKGCTIFSPPTTIIFIVFLLFEGLLFGLFTLIMFCTQINSVMHDETGIEHLKKEAREKQGNWKDRMKDTFGGDFGISWFSPFSSLPYHRKKQEFYEV